MDASSSYNSGDNNSNQRDIDIITAVLESGNSIELPATGYSMFPTFVPGNRVLVKPLKAGTLPEPGIVLVFKDNNVLIMHRLIEISDTNSDNPIFIARGDSMSTRDDPWSSDQIIGVAVRCKSSKREHAVKTFIPGPLQVQI